MFDKIVKHLSLHTQGMISLLLGAILILGTLGKLEILQSILNSIMIFTGVILLIWGLSATKGLEKIKNFFHKPKAK